MTTIRIDTANNSQTEKPTQPVEIETVNETFTRAGYGEPDFAFYPVSSKILQKIFRHLWLVPTLLLIAILSLNFIIFLNTTDSTNRRQIALWLSDHIYVYEEGSTIVWNTYQSPFGNLESSNRLSIQYILIGWDFEDADHFWQAYEGYKAVRSNWIDTRFYVAPFLIFLIFAAALFSRFIQRAPKLFLDLANSGRLSPNSDESTAGVHWNSFAVHLNQQLVSRRRWFFVVFLMALSLFTFLMISYGRGNGSISLLAILTNTQQDSPSNLWQIIFEFIVILGIPVILGSIFGLGLWTLIIVANHVSMLPSVFEINIEPKHRDDCGGLKRIGDITLSMTTIIVSAGLYLSFMYMTGVVQGSIPQISYATYIGIVIIATVSLFTFFKPVWHLHSLMVQERDTFRDDAAASNMPIQQEARQLLDAAKWDDGGFDELSNRLALHETLYPSDIRFPTWPFSTKMRLAFLSGLLPQIATIIVGRFISNQTIADNAIDIINKLLTTSAPN